MKSFLGNILALAALRTAVLADPCTPTGPGVCNLGYSGWMNLSGGDYWTWTSITIFDRGCHAIGGRTDNGYGLAFFLPFSIDSQLRYTVDMKQLPTTDLSNMEFWYAGKGYFGNPACTVTQQGHEAIYNIECQHAFDC